MLLRGLKIRERALPPDHPDLAANLETLADLCRDQRRYAEPEALYRRALAIYDDAYPPSHPERLALLKGYAQLLRATGRMVQAKVMEREAETRT
jgi:tetratricopeptide (TPR) repeat protein